MNSLENPSERGLMLNVNARRDKERKIVNGTGKFTMLRSFGVTRGIYDMYQTNRTKVMNRCCKLLEGAREEHSRFLNFTNWTVRHKIQ